eukprot:352792_1
MSSTILFLVLFPVIHGQIQIWYEKMNTSSRSWSDNPPTSIEMSNPLCPTPNMYCWTFASGLSTKRIDSTTGYTAVQLVFSVSTSSMNGQDRCVIEYSADATTFHDIARVTAATTGITDTFIAWGNAADLQPALTIQLSTINGGGHTCYFNEFTLQGTPITPQPTTAHPSLQPSISPSQPPSVSSPTWIIGSNPHASTAHAVGYDSTRDTILLFGGKQFVTFKHYQFTVVDPLYLSEQHQAYGFGQFYSQLGDDLWYIFGKDDSPNINEYFIKIDTETRAVSTSHFVVPTSVDTGGCLVTIPGYLIVLGGNRGGQNHLHNLMRHRSIISPLLSGYQVFLF